MRLQRVVKAESLSETLFFLSTKLLFARLRQVHDFILQFASEVWASVASVRANVYVMHNELCRHAHIQEGTMGFYRIISPDLGSQRPLMSRLPDFRDPDCIRRLLFLARSPSTAENALNKRA